MFLQSDLLQNKHTEFFVLVYFVCHTPQFKMLVFASQSEIWIAENFNFSVYEDSFIVVMEISIFTKCKPR